MKDRCIILSDTRWNTEVRTQNGTDFDHNKNERKERSKKITRKKEN